MDGRFGDLLATARMKKKITLRKLSQLVSLSPSFLSELEKGRKMPPKDDEKLHDLALILNINEEHLKHAARKERVKKSPKLFEKLFNADQDLAWGLYRAAEDASEDDLQAAFRKALDSLRNKEG